MNRRTTSLLSIAALALTLAACGGQSPAPSAPTTPVAEPTTSEPAPEPSTSEPEPTTAAPTETESKSAPAADVPEGTTAPGTVLAFGESATVEYTDVVGYTGTIEITVQAPVIGTDADFVDSSSTIPDGSSAAFITATAVGVDEASADLRTIAFSTDMSDHDADGNRLMGWVDFDMTACQTVSSLPSPFGPGVEYTSCRIAWVPDGQELTEVRFRPSTMPAYESDPIVWSN